MIILMIAPVIAQNMPAQTEPVVIFSEILTKSDSDKKFIELYNLSDVPLELDNWKIQRTNSTGTKDWSASALVALSGTVQPRGYFLIANPFLSLQADISHNLTNLNANEGNLRIVDSSGFVHDLFGWGQGSIKADGWPLVRYDDANEITSFVADESFKRKVNEDGRFIDTNNNSEDFFISNQPTPRSTPKPASGSSVTSGNSADNTTTTTNNESAQGSSQQSGPFAKLEISELFIDPDKPQTDAEDEFVEIFNPTKEPIDLEGYVIQTGMKYSYKFTLPSISIKSGQYLALFSIDTKLTLSNTEGQARLLDPTGGAIYEAPVYQKAKPNTAWANISGSWQWTSQPTPNAPNVLAAVASAGSDASQANGRTYLNQGRALSADEGRKIYEEPPTAADNQIDTAVVAGVGAMALLYAGNEYRYDMANFVAKIKRYFASRRDGGAAA